MTKNPVPGIKGGHRDDTVLPERRDLIYPYDELGEWLKILMRGNILDKI